MYYNLKYYTNAQMLMYNVYLGTMVRLWKPSLMKQDVPDSFYYEYDEE